MYKADTYYCDDCGASIASATYIEKPEPADYPLHCGCGAFCKSPVCTGGNEKFGKWLGNDLTEAGRKFVAIATRGQGPLSTVWRDCYSGADLPIIPERMETIEDVYKYAGDIGDALHDWCIASRSRDDCRRVAAALADGDFSDCPENRYCAVTIGRREYLVYTYSEREAALRDYYTDYFNEFVRPEIPESIVDYVNEDRWIEDQVDNCDAGGALACYDGCENCITLDGRDYFVYRTN